VIVEIIGIVKMFKINYFILNIPKILKITKIFLLIVRHQLPDDSMFGIGDADIPALAASRLAGFSRIKMILAGFSFYNLVVPGYFKTFDRGFVGFDLWHIYKSIMRILQITSEYYK